MKILLYAKPNPLHAKIKKSLIFSFTGFTKNFLVISRHESPETFTYYQILNVHKNQPEKAILPQLFR